MSEHFGNDALRQFYLLIFIIDRQLFKSAIIDFAGDVVLIEPFEQTVNLFHAILRRRVSTAALAKTEWVDRDLLAE